MTPRLGRVTQTSPLLVRLNGDTEAAPAEPYKGLTTVINQEVLVQTVSGRRLIVWAAA